MQPLKMIRKPHLPYSLKQGFDHKKVIRFELHRLRGPQRIDFKVLVYAYDILKRVLVILQTFAYVSKVNTKSHVAKIRLK